jgi:hypothetical protein
MKNIFYSAMLLFLPTLVLASESEFSYDKNALTTEFSQLDKIETYVEKNNVSYTELSNSPVFEGNIELTNAIAVKPNLKFEDVDWGSFAWGFCCWPVGIFTVLINDDKDQNSKNSFWAGLGGSVIAYSVAYVVVFAISIGSGFSSF